MICLECAAAADRRDAPAVGICGGCGAAVCLAHALIGHPAGLGGPAQPLTRRLTCRFCATDRPGMRPAAGPDVVTARRCADPTCLC